MDISWERDGHFTNLCPAPVKTLSLVSTQRVRERPSLPLESEVFSSPGRGFQLILRPLPAHGQHSGSGAGILKTL